MRHCALVLLFSFRVHSNTAERQETPTPLQPHTSHCVPDYVITTVADQPPPPSSEHFLASTAGALKKWHTITMQGRGEDGGDGDEVVGGGINWCSCWKHSECLTLKVPRSQFLGVSAGAAQNSPFFLLRRRYCGAWMRACKWVHKKTVCSLHPLRSAVWKGWIAGTAPCLCGND